MRVLFLCTGNSARSIIAAALLRGLGGDRFEVESAGTAPKGINPYTVRVLEEAGIGLEGDRSKHVSELEGQEFDYVITVCDSAAEACPVFPAKTRRLHWSFPDPASIEGDEQERLAAFRRTREGMRERVSGFLSTAGSKEGLI
jgi:arsenate reductase (thioredoxin)